MDSKLKDKLEAAYEREKRASYLFKKSNRIYHQILKAEDVALWDHLVNKCEMAPEMQLMRWIRCMLAREFDPIDVTLTCWDFILGGAYTCFIQKNQSMLLPSLDDRK